MGGFERVLPTDDLIENKNILTYLEYAEKSLGTLTWHR